MFMLRIAQGHFEILKRRRSSATFKITADMSRKRFLNQPDISPPFDLFSSFDNKQQHQLQLGRFHIQTEKKNMSSKLLIVLCLMASSTRSQLTDPQLLGDIGEMQVATPASTGPADAYRFVFDREEPREDPIEFLTMCNLFRKYLYMPFGTTIFSNP